MTLCLHNTVLTLKNIHLACFIICVCIQTASFPIAALPAPLWGEIQKQLLTDSSFGTNPLCPDTVSGMTLPEKAASAVQLLCETMAVARSDAYS